MTLRAVMIAPALFKKRVTPRAGSDPAEECLQDPRPALPLTLGHLQRRLTLGCLAMALQAAVVPLIQDPLVSGVAGDLMDGLAG